MRHGMIGTSALVMALTIGSWFLGPTPEAQGEAADESARVMPFARTDGRPDPPARESLATPTPTTSIDTVAVAAVVDGDAGAARFLLDLNARRERDGLEWLAPHPVLDRLAQSWAETLALEGTLRHSELIYDVIAGPWTTAGENVGYGPTAPAIFTALEASPGHLANMVNPDFTSVGIGVVRVDGVLWTAHLFAG